MILASNFTLFLMTFMVDILWAATVSPLASQPSLTKTHIIYIGGDYDDYNEETPQPKPNSSLPRLTTARFTPQQCEYDLCVVQDVPCFELSAQTKCYCPGLTGLDQVPESPQLRELKQRASGEVEVYWCAPLSAITHYKVVMDDEDGPVFSESSRNATIQGLKFGSRVCVVAINNAGFSVKNDRSCARFEPQQTSQAALMSGVIMGCVGFLVLLSLAALLLWRRKSCKKAGTLDGEGLRNPSYSASETI
ncbi:LRRN4 C-terminal-like protein [Pygocentrus nattereri]|uniref:LRRN4 C-terminal-like protein n=1 Tax=Pygocentrus nattereri TaxID=42514 RepID=UPI000814202F|nr:LRRN4 C-terminal-like protein [Pygocentrus nattereri]